MKRARSPARPRRGQGGLKRLMAAPYSSTNSAPCRWARKNDCCARSNGEVARIGSSRPIRVDCRIVAATNEDLPARAEAGTFRADLLDRLSFEVVTLPPLRERDGDIPVLAEYFGRRMATELEWDEWPGFTPRAMAALEGYAWPGNVRELRNVIERAVYRADDFRDAIETIVFDPFASPWKPRPATSAASLAGPASPSAPPSDTPALDQPQTRPQTQPQHVTDLRAAVDGYEKAILESAMARCRFNQKQTAETLGLTYDQLRHSLKKHGLL